MGTSERIRKSLNSSPLLPAAPILFDFGWLPPPDFHLIYDPEIPLNCNNNAKCIFIPSQGLPLWRQESIHKYFFQDALLDILLGDLVLIFYENGRFRDPSKSSCRWVGTNRPSGAKMVPKLNMFLKKHWMLINIGRHLAYFWHPFGSNWLPFGAVSVSCLIFVHDLFRQSLKRTM